MNTRIMGACIATWLSFAGCGDSKDASASIAAPTALKVEALEGGAHLTWKDNSNNESEFMIERMVGTADWSTLASVPFDTTQYHDASIAPGTTYMYRVMAMPKSGTHSEGAYSGEVTFVAPTVSTGSSAGGASGSTGEHTGHVSGAAGS